jgi:hypothetical protein
MPDGPIVIPLEKCRHKNTIQELPKKPEIHVNTGEI